MPTEKERKVKIVQFAKDLNEDPQKIAEEMQAMGHNVKKTGSLTTDEMNLLLEKFTTDYKSKTLDEFNSNKESRKEYLVRKAEKEAKIAEDRAKKKAEEDAVKQAEKAAEENKAEAKNPSNKKVEKGGEKKQVGGSNSNGKGRENNRNDRQEDRNNRSNRDGKQGDRRDKRDGDRQGKNNNNRGERRDVERRDRRDGDRRNNNNSRSDRRENRDNNNARQAAKPQVKVESTPAKPVAPKAPVNTGVKAGPVKKKEQAKKQEHGTKTTLSTFGNSNASESASDGFAGRTVDTRGTYVDLDKYNERYDNMASTSNVKDNYSTKKQKINQKLKQYNNRGSKKKKNNDPEEILKRKELERARKKQLEVEIPESITVGDLAQMLKVTAAQVIKELFKLGVMASINEEVDFDTAALAADALGAKVKKKVTVTIEEKLIDDTDDDESTLVERPPVVCIMGHVDHGKTSILDKIRQANVQATEAGGITQAIGAYQVNYNGKDITFLDTPGHEAFTAMRARGADITDIAVLVVAADDGVMPQTIESINHAKAANIPIIVAINKMDKPGANPERVKQELANQGVMCEDWGGDVISVPVSAKTGEGIDDLLENILLVAEVNELKANPDRLAKGAVIEARLDKGRGPVATLLVQKGTLRKGDTVIAGTAVGRVRSMTDYNGKPLKEAGPSVPVSITGLDEVPSAGDTFDAVENEKLAKDLVEQRKQEEKETKFKSYQKVTLENLFSQIEEGEIKELPIIIKADVQGSAEAVKQSLEELSNDEVKVKIIHSAVGAVNESDVILASASNAIIVGFNVRPETTAAEDAKREGVDIRLYRVIYDAIDEIKDAMKGMLAPKTREVEVGRIEVRKVYKISGVGTVAGCYVLSGKAVRDGIVRVVRDGIIVADDEIADLKRFKDQAKEVAEGYECGISLKKFADIKEGDIFECYRIEEYTEE